MKNEEYRGQIPVEEIQRDYFNHFNHTYWMHKANALINYINNPSTIDKLRFKGDNDSEETILNNLKMELHMMVFHCSETLFLNIFSIVYAPTLPWIWISRCEPSKLHDLIKLISNKGLAALHQSPEILLRENLFSEIKEGHQNYEKSKSSSIFVTKYIETLAHDYLDHNEYNSYKHGLRSFVGRSKFQAFHDATSEKIFDMESDTIQFLEFEKKNKNGKPYNDNGKPYVLVKLTTKGFDYIRDYQIIYVNSAILYNLFYTRKVAIRTASDNSRKIGYYLFEDFKVDEIFKSSSQQEGADLFKKFTI